MTLNSYLLAQAAVATVAATPDGGISLGAWIALVACGLTLAGVIYKSGIASQKATNVESMVGMRLDSFEEKLDKVCGFVDDTQKVRSDYIVWRESISRDVRELRGDPSVHTHQRGADR